MRDNKPDAAFGGSLLWRIFPLGERSGRGTSAFEQIVGPDGDVSHWDPVVGQAPDGRFFLFYAPDLEQGADFIGKEALHKIKEEGPKRKLVGVEIGGEKLGSYNDGSMIDVFPVHKDGSQIGRVTSACFSPRLEKNIGYAMVPIEQSVGGQRNANGSITNAASGLCLDVTGASPDPQDSVAVADGVQTMLLAVACVATAPDGVPSVTVMALPLRATFEAPAGAQRTALALDEPPRPARLPATRGPSKSR